MGIRCANHVTPLYPQKLALASLTGGGRSVGQNPCRAVAPLKNDRKKNSNITAIFTKHVSQTIYKRDNNAQYIDKHMHSIKYDKIKIIKQVHDKGHSYKFQYTNVIFRESM